MSEATWHPKIGDPVRMTDACPDAELWNRQGWFVAGVQRHRIGDRYTSALDVFVSATWPEITDPTDGFLINRPDGPDQIEPLPTVTRPAPKADACAMRESESLCNNGPSIDVMIGGKWCAIDKDIAPVVAALNQVGCATVASCSGHGHRPGNIALADGREIIIARNFEEGRRIDRLFPIGANGEPAPKADGLVEELERLLESASDGPWVYRPYEYDDWGVIRGPEKTVDWADYPVRPHIAQARRSDIQDEEYLAECRRTKTDPWAGDAKLIVWLRNHADAIAALKDGDVVLEEHLQWMRDKSFSFGMGLAGRTAYRAWRDAADELERRIKERV